MSGDVSKSFSRSSIDRVTGCTRLESTPAGFGVFLSDPDPESKVYVKPDPDPESLFIFGSNRILSGYFLSKNRGKFWLGRW